MTGPCLKIGTTILPLELLDRIFGFLDDEIDAWYTLKACSVIRNPVLRAAIDRHMYTHIRLCKFNLLAGQVDSEDIYRYLSSNPHVANYVRTLHITMIPRFKDSYHNEVTPILQMLTSSLKTITLSSVVHIDSTGTTARLVRFSWMDLSAPFRTALLDCIWSPNIIEVSMERVGELPLSIFNTCSGLKKLSLLDCTPSTLDAQFPPQINSLVLLKIEDLEIVVSWATTRHDLRSLKFEWHNNANRSDVYCLTRLLDSYAHNLIELDLDFRLTPLNFKRRHGRMDMDPPLTISHLQKLTQLTASVTLDSDHRVVDFLLPGVITLAAASTSLKRFILRSFIWPGSHNFSGVSDFFEPLVSLADHPSLEHIEIRVSTVIRRDDWKRIVSEIVFALKNAPELEILWNKSVLSVSGPEFD